MTKLQKRKAALLERISVLEDEALLSAVERTLEGTTHHALSAEQLRQLDSTMERYLSGEVRTYTPEEVRARALKAIRG